MYVYSLYICTYTYRLYIYIFIYIHMNSLKTNPLSVAGSNHLRCERALFWAKS